MATAHVDIVAFGELGACAIGDLAPSRPQGSHYGKSSVAYESI
jgi:hypothetical protein